VEEEAGVKGAQTLDPEITFPNDDNGDVLRRLQSDGDALTKPRDIDFTVIFPDEQAAKNFAGNFGTAGYKLVIEMTRCNKDLPWDVRIVKNMIPSYEGICAFEDELEGSARPYGGRNDGWGCISQK
jgi:hypothetical protein